jgi:hypothetical protein
MDGQMNKKANARTDEQTEASCPNTIVCGELNYHNRQTINQTVEPVYKGPLRKPKMYPL